MLPAGFLLLGGVFRLICLTVLENTAALCFIIHLRDLFFHFKNHAPCIGPPIACSISVNMAWCCADFSSQALIILSGGKSGVPIYFPRYVSVKNVR